MIITWVMVWPPCLVDAGGVFYIRFGVVVGAYPGNRAMQYVLGQIS